MQCRGRDSTMFGLVRGTVPAVVANGACEDICGGDRATMEKTHLPREEENVVSLSDALVDRRHATTKLSVNNIQNAQHCISFLFYLSHINSSHFQPFGPKPRYHIASMNSKMACSISALRHSHLYP